MNYNKKLVILKQICSKEWNTIHSKNLLHRDLGARNILLDDCLTNFILTHALNVIYYPGYQFFFSVSIDWSFT